MIRIFSRYENSNGQPNGTAIEAESLDSSRRRNIFSDMPTTTWNVQRSYSHDSGLAAVIADVLNGILMSVVESTGKLCTLTHGETGNARYPPPSHVIL